MANSKLTVSGVDSKYVMRSLLQLVVNVLKFALLNCRYLLLTPAWLSSQVIYDRQMSKLINVNIGSQNDFQTLCQIYLAEDYSLSKLKRCSEISEYYKDIIAAGKVPLVIDCGGNIGLAARYFSENYDKAKVLYIEPDSDNVRLAKLNNTLGNVEFFECAVGSEAGHGMIIDPGRGNNSYRMAATCGGPVRIISINDLLVTYDDSMYTPFLVKIDIEGFEDELFSNNIDWIEKFPLLIIELHDWMLPKSNSASNFIRAIAPLNRDFVYRGENVFSISNTLI